METKKDPREVELAEVQSRLSIVVNLVKCGVTLEGVDREIEAAEKELDDKTDVFIFHDSFAFRGSKHLRALLRIDKAIETKRLFEGRSDIHAECVSLFERKFALIKEIQPGFSASSQ